MLRATDADELHGTVGAAVANRNRDQLGHQTARGYPRRQFLGTGDPGASLASVLQSDADLPRLLQEGKETQRVWAASVGKCPGRLAQGKADPRGFRTQVVRTRHRDRE